ncbi:hypothetical protein V1512DRAFT_260529 [Lipomyces arxii]|uniref:uncharacterized protein n=1 Tax=Lipomyces arxii TaxID=56418 RepID=UPI0034CD46C7
MTKERLARPPSASNIVIIPRSGLFNDEDEPQAELASSDSKPYAGISLEFEEKPVATSTTEPDTAMADFGEFSFSLFSTSTNVKVEAPPPPEAPEAAAPIFVDNKRPKSYYVVDPSDTIRLAQIQECSISGEDIISQSKMSWPGMRMPWRVIHIPLNSPDEKPKRHTKPSKKRRLLLKKRQQTRPAGKSTPFKDNDLRNWKYYNIKSSGKPNKKKAKEDGKPTKVMKPYKKALQ